MDRGSGLGALLVVRPTLLIEFSKSVTVIASASDLAARFARGLSEIFLYPPIRGRREHRVRAAPAVSCATVHKTKRTRAYRFSGGIRRSLRNGFNAYSELSPVNGSFATVALRAFSQDLTPAPRCQDHTPLPSASSALVRSAIRVHRIPVPR